MKPPTKLATRAPSASAVVDRGTQTPPTPVERRTFIQQMAATGFVLAAGPDGVRRFDALRMRIAHVRD